MSIHQALIRFALPAITCLCLLSGGDSVAQPHGAEAETTPKRVPPKERPLEFWVGQLGHDQYYRREVATAQLTEAGLAAVPILQRSIASGDLEATERAIVVLGKIALEQSPNDESGAWGVLTNWSNPERAVAGHVPKQRWLKSGVTVRSRLVKALDARRRLCWRRQLCDWSLDQ